MAPGLGGGEPAEAPHTNNVRTPSKTHTRVGIEPAAGFPPSAAIAARAHMRGSLLVTLAAATAFAAALATYFINASRALRSHRLNAHLAALTQREPGFGDAGEWVATWLPDDTLAGGGPPRLTDARLRSRAQTGGGSVTLNLAGPDGGLWPHVVVARLRPDGSIGVAAARAT